MHTEHAGAAGLAVHFSKKTQTLLAGGRDGAELQKKVHQFRMFVHPAPRAYVSPELGFFRSDDAHMDTALIFSRGLLHRTVKDVADLDRPVIAPTEQVQRSHARQRAYLVKHRCSAFEKEALNRIQRGGA